jgi:peptidoglycan lytic transglycosylase G
VRNVALFALALLLSLAAWLAFGLFVPVSPGGQKFVMLRPGYSTRRIARELKAAGVIRSRDAFVLWHALHRRPSLKAGEYLFEHDANVIAIHQRLARGDIYVHTVVIPEGFNMFDIATALESAGLGSAQSFLKEATTDTALISDLAPHAASLEGYFFPSTYEFTRTQSMHDIAAEMVKQFRIVAAQIGLIESAQNQNPQVADERSADRKNYDIQKTVDLASIIEKETAVPDERPEVASVYVNRLVSRIPLQADPSVIYAELLQGTYSGALHHSDMQFDSEYNTYRHAGLPPGPIANPGKSSLQAAMHPAETKFYYFVSDGNGHHRFATTLEEHNKNVAALRRMVAQQR